MSTLRDQLARFHAAITGRAALDTARELVERGDIDELARLHVYEHAYTARIASVLVHDYPKLASMVGEAELRALTADYVRAHPPSAFSLREVGVHLAAWLRATGARPEIVDLVQLERARTDVFDGPDGAPLSREDLGAMDPADFPSLRLQLVPSSRAIVIATNADDIWDALESETPVPDPVAADRTVLVWRREITVVHRTLEADEARVLPLLVEGTTFGHICELLAEGADDEAAAARAIELLVRWLDAQVLYSTPNTDDTSTSPAPSGTSSTRS